MIYLLALTICVASAQGPASDDDVRVQFEQTIDECIGYGFYGGDLYPEPAKNDGAVFAMFKTKYDAVAEHNSYSGASYKQAINCFATVDHSGAVEPGDLMMEPPPNDVEIVSFSSTGDSPDEYDRRDDGTTTSVRDQGNSSCNAYWAFSAMAALESKYLILTGDDPADVDFSEQQFLDCTSYESYSGWDGCKRGWMSNAWIRLQNEEKSVLLNETQYPYTMTDNTCDVVNKTNAMSKVVMQDPAYKYAEDYSESTIMGAATQERIYNQGAISIYFRVEDAFRSYSSGIFNTPCSGDYVVHALALIGYTQAAFVAKNSWGTWWGESGYVRLSRTNGNLCSMLSATMWPLMECSWGVDTKTGKCLADKCGGCENNGRCVNEEGLGYKCECLDGYTGDRCERAENCTGVVCENDAVCDPATGECRCKTGWTGDSCEEEADKCANVTCETGKTCNTATGGCEDGTCTKSCDGAKSECYWKYDKMKCRCPGMKYGRQCQKEFACDDAMDSTVWGYKRCQKKLKKNEAKFTKKCQKKWGKKHCPILCGFCAEFPN